MNRLTKDGLASISKIALELGTQDPERIRQVLCPAMSRAQWYDLLRDHVAFADPGIDAWSEVGGQS
jgi:hypothetical protein